MKRRLLCAVLTLVMCMGLAVPAMAEEDNSSSGNILKDGVLNNTYIQISNVVWKEEEPDTYVYRAYGPAIRCKMPVEIVTLSDVCLLISRFEGRQDGTGSKYSVEVPVDLKNPGPGIKVENLQEVEMDLGSTEKALLHKSGLRVTITEPGDYWISYSGYRPSDYYPDSMVLFLGNGYAATVLAEGEEPTIPEPKPDSKSDFTDVPSNAYYADAVAWAVKKDVVKGTSNTTFSPNTTCTNAQILTMFWRANGSPEPTKASPFPELKEDKYYYKAVLWAHEKGLITSFDASAPCTRSMTVSYLWKLAGSPASGSSSFTDVPGDVDYAKAVAWAASEKIVNGMGDNTFAPDATCTRGQIVTFLFRAMGRVGELPEALEATFRAAYAWGEMMKYHPNLDRSKEELEELNRSLKNYERELAVYGTPEEITLKYLAWRAEKAGK